MNTILNFFGKIIGPAFEGVVRGSAEHFGKEMSEKGTKKIIQSMFGKDSWKDEELGLSITEAYNKTYSKASAKRFDVMERILESLDPFNLVVFTMCSVERLTRTAVQKTIESAVITEKLPKGGQKRKVEKIQVPDFSNLASYKNVIEAWDSFVEAAVKPARNDSKTPDDATPVGDNFDPNKVDIQPALEMMRNARWIGVNAWKNIDSKLRAVFKNSWQKIVNLCEKAENGIETVFIQVNKVGQEADQWAEKAYQDELARLNKQRTEQRAQKNTPMTFRRHLRICWPIYAIVLFLITALILTILTF